MIDDNPHCAWCRWILAIEVIQLAVALINVVMVIVTLIGYQRMVGHAFRQTMR